VSAADAEALALVARACRILGKLDVTHGSLGHVSLRLGDTETMLIKGKGPGEVGLRYTQPRDILTVDFDANKVAGVDDLQPPSESYIHSWLYRLRPDVRSVVHVHPEHAVLLTICEKEVLPIYGAYGSGAKLGVDGVRVYPRTLTVADDHWGEDFARFVGSSNVALMRAHGVTVVGTGVEDATVRTMALNELVTMNYKAYLLGTPRPIPVEEQQQIGRPLDPARKRGSSGGDIGMRAAWRYYAALAEEADLA
jgi:ribulose-5-phosphate 4-epimerase/fuculose-1-phosphate aldolase